MNNYRILELANINESRLLLENFKQVKAAWLKRDMSSSQDQSAKAIDNAFEKFKKLKAKNILKPHEKDITKYPTYQSLIDVINKYEGVMTKREKVKDAIIHFENDDYRIVEPKNHDASCKHGTHTSWCISVPSNPKHWSDYVGYGIKFLFIQDFKNDLKYALSIYPHDKDTPDNEIRMEAFDQYDATLSVNGLLHRYNITSKMYANPVDMTDWNWFVSWLKSTYGENGLYFNKQKKTIDIVSNRHYIPTEQMINKSQLNFKNSDGWKLDNIKGDFLVSNTNLKSLSGNGVPRYIHGILIMSDSDVETFEGGPLQVMGGSFRFNHTPIKNFKGFPRLGPETRIQCDEIHVRDLVGLPKKVFSFRSVNHWLKTLKGCPEEIVTDFIIYGGNLESLEYFPKKIGGELWITINETMFKTKFNSSMAELEGAIRKICDVKGKITIVQN